MIDLRKLKSSNTKINEKQTAGKFHIINGNLNLLGWVVLKSNIIVADKYDIALAKTSIVKPGNYWQKLVNTDDKRSILFLDDYRGNRFQNTEFTFSNLKDKYHNDHNVVMKYLEEYDFVMINILNFIKNNHRDFTIDKPIVVTKKKHINKITKK